MKVRNGKLSLGKNDTRTGNFVITKEEQHYKMQDINGYWSTRVGFMHPMHTLIQECIKAKNMDYLDTIAKMLYALSTIPPDRQMLEDMYNAYNAQIERMRAQMEPSDDEQALQQTKEAYQAKEELKKIIDDKPQGDTQR